MIIDIKRKILYNVINLEEVYGMKKKTDEAKIEKYINSKGETIFAVKIRNIDTLNWVTIMRTKSFDVAEAWAYKIAYSVAYNID